MAGGIFCVVCMCVVGILTRGLRAFWRDLGKFSLTFRVQFVLGFGVHLLHFGEGSGETFGVGLVSFWRRV